MMKLAVYFCFNVPTFDIKHNELVKSEQGVKLSFEVRYPPKLLFI